MVIVAMLIHLISAAIFALGIVLMLAVGWQADITDAHVAATVALLGLNVAVHYFRVALESDASDAKLSHGQQREQVRQQVRDPRQVEQHPPASENDAARSYERGRRYERQRIEREAAPPERSNPNQARASQELADASERVAQLMAEAERNRERRD